MGIGGRLRRRCASRGDQANLGHGCREQCLVRQRGERPEQFRVIARDQPGVDVAGGERLMGDDALQEGNVGCDADVFACGECVGKPAQRRRTILAVDDQLGDHRVVPGRDLVARPHARIDAHVRSGCRRRQMHEPANRRQKAAIRILGVDARFDRMTVDRELLLRLRQRLAGSDAKLPFDQVGSRDHLGDGVLDLQSRVHFHEIERAVAGERVGGDELDRSGADIADRLRRGHRRHAHRMAMLRLHSWRGRLLEHLLVAPLHRAVALEQVDRIAVRIREHLDLDVPRRSQILLDQHAVVAERRLRLALRGCERSREVRGALGNFHPLAATARRRLDQYRIAGLFRFAGEQRRGLIVAVITGNEGNLCRAHDFLGRGF